MFTEHCSVSIEQIVLNDESKGLIKKLILGLKINQLEIKQDQKLNQSSKFELRIKNLKE